MIRYTRYMLKATCSGCGRYGSADDVTLTCKHCGTVHVLTEGERRQRDGDRALQSMYSRRGFWERIRELVG